MTPQVLFLIRSDPTESTRPIEGLRIALSFVASWESTQVVLINGAITLLAKDIDDAHDLDILEKLRPTFKDLETPFYVEEEAASQVELDPDFLVHAISQDRIADMLVSAQIPILF